MKIGVRVMPRPEVLDTQGRAVLGSLNRAGYASNECRVGKYILLDLPNLNKEEALQQAKKMAEHLLCNSLIETYELEVQ